jgi:hypothetical protein
MIKKLVLVATLSAVLGLCSLPVSAQSTNKSSSKKETTKESGKKATSGPFHGKLAALDKSAKTIKRADKPATLEDAVVGEEVSGYVKANDSGQLVATTLNLGPKASKNSEKKSGK